MYIKKILLFTSYIFVNYVSKVNSFILNNNPKLYKINKLKCSSDEIENNKPTYYKFASNPTLQPPNENGELTWYPIGTDRSFSYNYPSKVTVRGINYAIWKNRNGTYYGIRDACSHQGASMSGGCINNNIITCPYHSYKFDGITGHLTSIPSYTTKCNQLFNINSYKVIEKKGLVYLNTVPLTENNTDLIDPTYIWIEPEAYNNTFKSVILNKKFLNYAKLVSINSLDICHISTVHTFGNKRSPNPLNDPLVEKINDNKYHFKIEYVYKTGPNSIVAKFFEMDEITVENEFVLPHTTVARVKFGKYTSTIVTTAQPISNFITILYVKAYRNYWYSIPNLNPLSYIENYIGNYITENTMEKTLNEDKLIIDNIDTYNYESMHGKFSIKYDRLSNLYKHYYKRFYENGKSEI
jgi:phenylpropionate dioxygenase-like ring-hydroxylating dioxygenase large terminal subunit